MEETLEEGLSKIFGSGAGVRPQGTATTKPTASSGIPSQIIQERIQRALSAYEEAIKAQRGGDWSRYGEEIQRLGDILKQ